MHLKKEKKNLKNYRSNKTGKKIDFPQRTSVIIPRGKDWDWALFSKMAAGGRFTSDQIQEWLRTVIR